jgi:hypothetical protein
MTTPSARSHSRFDGDVGDDVRSSCASAAVGAARDSSAAHNAVTVRRRNMKAPPCERSGPRSAPAIQPAISDEHRRRRTVQLKTSLEDGMVVAPSFEPPVAAPQQTGRRQPARVGRVSDHLVGVGTCAKQGLGPDGDAGIRASDRPLRDSLS